jgi:hypothetical protein
MSVAIHLKENLVALATGNSVVTEKNTPFF